MAGPFADAAGNAAGAVSSLFAGFGANTKADMDRIEAQADLLKGKGAELEGESYTRAQTLAMQNKDYAEQSTAIQEAQAGRSLDLNLGAGRAAAGASGLRESGSVIDVLADSARQGELQQQVLGYQGAITQAGYQEQYEVYGNMVKASQVAVEGAELANKEHLMAADAENTAATGDFITAGIKGVSAVASLFSGLGSFATPAAGAP